MLKITAVINKLLMIILSCQLRNRSLHCEYMQQRVYCKLQHTGLTGLATQSLGIWKAQQKKVSVMTGEILGLITC